MKKTLSNMLMMSLLLMVIVPVQGRENVKERKRTTAAAPRNSFKAEAGDCLTPAAQADLDINNVRARLLTGGDLWWNLSDARYQVPKAAQGSSLNLNALFAGAIWITGLDAGGNLKCASQRYRAGGDDYWPGPLDNIGNVNKATCTKYDRHFSVLGSNIDAAKTLFANGGGNPIPASLIAEDVLKWPAKGNPHIQSDGFFITQNLAPFYDFDGDGLYDPTKGDWPSIYNYNESQCIGDQAGAFADQMVYWVINDKGNVHTETNGEAMGIQVGCLAFAFATTDEINNMTFYRYNITNKSNTPVLQTYISQWSDPDLGNFNNDRVGCDTVRSIGFVYNADFDADNGGVSGYQNQHPALAMDFFEGPLNDSSEQLGLSSFVYFTNGAAAGFDDPSSAAQYRNYQTCRWGSGIPFTNGGTGVGGTSNTCFIFPGNPSDPSQWSECSVASELDAGDRRFLQTSGPFTMLPGVTQNVTIGVVFVRPPGIGVGFCPNINLDLGQADDKAQALFDQCFQLLDGPSAPTLQIRELENELIINLTNLKGSNNFAEGYDQEDKTIVCTNCDRTYTFEGYKLYQLSAQNVSATDLTDPAKAKLIARVDVKNGIGRIVNFVKDQILNLDIPYQMVDNENADKGITHSFRITKDEFATGEVTSLINYKTYYYTAVAYAHNEWRKFDQLNPTVLAQKTPFLQGRKNYAVYAATPHRPDSRNDGTIVNSAWGDGTEVKRLEGRGNGGNPIDVTNDSKNNAIAGPGYLADTLVYPEKNDPIGFQIVDPIQLQEADFELPFYEEIFVDAQVANNITLDSPFVYLLQNSYDSLLALPEWDEVPGTRSSKNFVKWQLNDLTNNRTIFSDRDISSPYEQVISYPGADANVDYGFSLKIGQPVSKYSTYVLQGGNRVKANPVYEPISGTISYQNPAKQWLSFIRDNGTSSVSNWIRSGADYVPSADPSPPNAVAFDSHWDPYNTLQPLQVELASFMDTASVFDKLAGGTWAPYCLAANFSDNTPIDGGPSYVEAPGFEWHTYRGSHVPPINTLDRLSSVDIVITPDKSKWTRCVVFETGEDPGTTEGDQLFKRTGQLANQGFGANKGQIRMSLSRDFDSNGNLVYQQGDTGRSWFPGYAINIETGERLNIAFGESSDKADNNGRDMLWNPTGKLFYDITFPGSFIPNPPIFGGKHFIYVFDTKYDEGKAAQEVLLRTYNKINTPTWNIDNEFRTLTRSLMWTSMPYLSAGYSLTDGYVPPDEVTVKLRVQRPFARFATNASGADSLPRYFFSTKGKGIKQQQAEVAKNALDLIRVVPNPYLAYSDYETNQNDTKVKITNLPNQCKITILALDGTLIRTLERDFGSNGNYPIELSDGNNANKTGIDNSIEWDLKNDKGIIVGSGVYIMHIEAPGIGQRSLKWYGAMRPTDVSNF